MTKELNDTISYNNLNDYKLITITDLNDSERYIIGKMSLIETINGNRMVTNLINDQRYFIKDEDFDENEVFISDVEDLEDYLITLGYLKEEYTAEDLETIYNEIIEFKRQKLAASYNNIIKVRV